MTLEEIKTKICDLRCSVEELQAEAHELWLNADSPSREEEIADYLDNELGYIATRLSDLEELDNEDEDDTEELQETEERLQEWWDDLSNDDKASIVGIPAPSRNDARGDEQYAFDDYCEKWWGARTMEQKKETYKEWADEMPWWEKE